jgi:TAG lipase/lysophosphatidylethanolamine acyltransferase
MLRLVAMEVQHRLLQLDALGLLSPSIRRFLLDENVPGASLTLVPELTTKDFLRLLENPTKESVDYWIRRGERSVWPAVGALKIRCAIEVELERGYQVVRRRKPFDLEPDIANEANERRKRGEEKAGTRKKKGRALSFGAVR